MNVKKASRPEEDTFRLIFESAPHGIYLLTSDWKFLTVNPALAYILGYESPSDLVASITVDRQYYAFPERSAEFKGLVAEHGLIRDFEAQVFRKDGSIIAPSRPPAHHDGGARGPVHGRPDAPPVSCEGHA